MKRVTCFYCGNVYAAPHLHQANPAEDNLEVQAYAGEFSPGIACPKCSTQNNVTGDLPDWNSRT